MRNNGGLKPQDILVLLKLLLWGEKEAWSYGKLGAKLGMNASEVHSAIKRAERSGLYDPLTRRPKRASLREFVLFGLPYVFPGTLATGKKVRGIPTAHSTAPLNEKLVADDQFVWPARGGKALGTPLFPLYRSVPTAASRDPRLHELLALIDALRTGRARDRELAKEYLEKRLS